jgi:hypothetical protein
LYKIPAASSCKKVKTAKASKTSIPDNSDNVERFSLIGDKDIDSYPPDVNRLVKEYSSLYMERSKKHTSLSKLGENNDQASIDARKPIIDEIKSLSDRMEFLFSTFVDFETNGNDVDPAQLWPENSDGDSSKVGAQSIEDLKTLKKNLQSSLTKDRNMLLYSIKTQPKDGKEKPMPAGPKRTILEKRIIKKEQEVADIDQRIADLM